MAPTFLILPPFSPLICFSSVGTKVQINCMIFRLFLFSGFSGRVMKFEELLMESTLQQTGKLVLEEGVMVLKEELEEERAMNKALRSALRGSTSSLPSLSLFLLPPQVQELIKELGIVEAEILCLDRKIEELKLQLYQERRQAREMQMDMSSIYHHHQQQQRTRVARQNIIMGHGESSIHDLNQQSQSQSQNYKHLPKYATTSHSRVSFGSAAEFLNTTSPGFWFGMNDDPNHISEELIRCLVAIYLELNHVSKDGAGRAVAVAVTKHHSLRPSLSQKANAYTYYQNAMNLDPYCVLPDSNTAVRDIGPYKNFIHITKGSMEVSHFNRCCTPPIHRLRVLLEKLSEVDLSLLTYKQKLAFWINVYNACIMHAILERGLPPSHDKLLTLMNKASLDVGGIVLNALAIEHFILRQPCEPENGLHDEKETLLRRAYGLGYSEPNLTFALCRGSWSSPALRVYTPEEVVNDLGRARVEYLEASVGVSSKKKIVIPELLQWHMKDFADDMESLLEWIYSQLPRSVSLKGLIMECLNRKSKTSLAKIVEIQPYEHEFRYLLSL